VKPDAATYFRESVADFLREQVLRPEYLSEEAITRKVVGKLVARRDFQEFLKSRTSSLPLDVQHLATGTIEHLGAEALSGLTHKLTGLMHSDVRDETHTDLFDILAMLRLAGRSQIHEVAEALLDVIGEDDLIVALMLDLGNPDDSPADLEAFQYQLRATSETVQVFPGRVLPFVSVHPDRPDYLHVLDTAVSSMGFVGVKLYPSLGYSIELAKRRELYAFCAAHDLPLLMHCNEGGFFWSEDAIPNCRPALWGEILKEFPSLRICFAHCGGDNYLARLDSGEDTWTREIFELMDRFPGVYADIAFHTTPMAGGEIEDKYFRNLRDVLAHATYGQRMLFGSDSWLVRQRLSEENYWKYFESRLTSGQFLQLCETNPQRFLGLPGADHSMPGRNIARYLEYVYANQDRLWTAPPAWVRDAVAARHPEGRPLWKSGNPRWSRNNQAHVRVFWFLQRNQFTSAQKSVPFDRAGRLALFELAYWVQGRASADEQARRARLVAGDLALYCRKAGGELESGWDEAHILEELTRAFQAGTATLSDLGALVDDMFHFPSEP